MIIKWTVLRNKTDLQEMDDYRNVFKGGCIEEEIRDE